VFVTGLSGSGKTVAMKSFEDLGYFCVDNLPSQLVGPFAELAAKGRKEMERVAIAMDSRERGYLKDFPEVLRRLRRGGFQTVVLFLEASQAVLLRRFSETRRPHPLKSRGGSLVQALRAERRKLAPIRKLADRLVNTSEMSVHELRRHLHSLFSEGRSGSGPELAVISFGYKYGLPPEADLVFDVRFLPNPFFEPKLRSRDGRHPAVCRFMLSYPSTRRLLVRLESFVRYLVPEYLAEGKSYLTLAVGCTGGQHRSVMVAERLAAGLRERGRSVRVIHRDLERERAG
jgi:UPF0042 nucleotide-binding protein